jgi:alpha-mannosidase
MGGFAAWLFGLAAEQPREYRRLLRIRKRIYRVVAQLDAEIVRSDEPVPFGQLDHSAFRPLRPGTAWGKKLDCAWLHITGTIPAGVPGATVMLGIRGEGLVVAPNGEPVDSVSTVWIQADLPNSGGKYRPLEHVDTSGGTVDFYADVAYNGFLLYPYGSAIYHGAHVAVP